MSSGTNWRASGEDHERAPHTASGIKEMLTMQRLKVPESLRKRLATTNIVESPKCYGTRSGAAETVFLQPENRSGPVGATHGRSLYAGFSAAFLAAGVQR
jgi:hypothetical protein